MVQYLIKLHHDKVVQGHEVGGVRLVLDLALVVDFPDELGLFGIGGVMEGVVPVLGLDQNILNHVVVGPVTEEFPHHIAEGLTLTGAARKAVDSLVLGAKGYQILHRWVRASLGNSSQKLATLQKVQEFKTFSLSLLFYFII